MKILLLLILSLTAGCEAFSEVNGCPEGWLEFTCRYPSRDKIYKSIKVLPKWKNSEQTHVSTKQDTWEVKNRFYLYHDTKKKILRVLIKQLTVKDEGKYQCSFQEEPIDECAIVKVELEKEKDGCQKPLNQTGYRTAKTTITCKNPGDDFEARDKFFCKESGLACQDVLSTSSLEKNGSYTLSYTKNNFSMTISNLTSQHNGVYWCGVQESTNRAAIRKINLRVQDIRNFTRFPTVGQNFRYWCEHNNASVKKFICKGEDPSICKPLANTENEKNAERFYMKEEQQRKKIDIIVRDVREEDAGTYWCGAENNGHRTFYHMFIMKVVSPGTSTPPVISSSSAPPAAGDSQVFTIVAIYTAVLILLLLVILVLAYKLFVTSKKRNRAAQNTKEDCYVYEEIQQHREQPNPGPALNSVYATANLPTNPSAFLHYTTVSFKETNNKSDDGAVKMQSAACEYSQVKSLQSSLPLS